MRRYDGAKIYELVESYLFSALIDIGNKESIR